jgi:2-C-methyl-D-erythritol 4-phosphate cytidylyltransferase
MIDVVYLNGGTGKRAKLGYPKQFARIGGKPILVHALEKLNNFKEINKIIIPTSPQEYKRTEEIIKNHNCTKKYKIIDGGETRQESVYYGLNEVKTKEVIIMESVRPFVSIGLIKKIINAKSNTTLFMPCISTPISVHGLTFERGEIGEVQTPQKFDTSMLFDIHNYTNIINSSDDCDLICTEEGIQPNVLVGEYTNIKITTPLDLKIAEVIYTNENNSNNRK